MTTYRHATPEIETNWANSLSFLHQLEMTPPPFCRSIWHKLKPPARTEFYTMYNNAISWVLDATPDLTPSVLLDERPPSYQTDASPFWKLLMLLEPLLLAPIQGTVHLSHSNALKARLSLLKAGRLPELHNQCWNPTPLPATDRNRNQGTKKKQQRQRHRHDGKLPPWRLAAAQQAADLGNYRAAFQRLTTNTPTATLTPPRIARCQHELFPPRRQPPPSTRTGGQRPTNQPPEANQMLRLKDDLFEAALRQMKAGTASGPFANCIDVIVSMALHKTTRSPDATRPYFAPIKSLMQLVVTAQIPPTIRKIMSSNYFLALHKDINNPERLRPIGIGTALRRVAAKTALVHQTDAIRPLLLKGGQYGIQIPGGVDFVAQTTASTVRRFIDRQDNTINNEPSPPPSRSLVLLDLTNMFNNVSRTEARKILLSKPATTPLVPLLDLLTNQPCHSWYFDEHQQAQYLLQEEGFPQGCPLSPLFSCLVLLALTTKINKEQALRATQQLRAGDAADDGLGGKAHTASIMDDTSVCLPHTDLHWFLQRFTELGKPLGIILNQRKTKILTSTTGTSPQLSLPHRDGLDQALTFLSPTDPTSAEITDGVRFLGQPIGSIQFAQAYIKQKLTTLNERIEYLDQLNDLQTQGALFRFSIMALLLHLLPADILLAHQDPNPRTTLWSSPVTHQTDRLIVKFLAQTTSLPEDAITTPSTLIASLPQRLGGLGFHHAAAAAYPRLITQTARAIQLASSTAEPVPSIHKQEYENWQHSTNPGLVTFRKALSLLANELADAALFDITRFDQHTHHGQTNHILREHVMPRLMETTPPDQRIFLPSLLNPLTSMALTMPL